MSNWIDKITEKKTLVTINGENNGPAYNYRVTPCMDRDGKFKGSYACFLDLATLPDYKSGAQIEAIAELIREIRGLGMQPVIGPDNRPLPALADGVKRVVGGFMVYANPAMTIKPKETLDAK